MFVFQLEAAFFRPLHLRHGLKAQHDGVLHTGTSAKNDNTKSGKIKSGGTNGKSGQRQIHVQIGSGKLVAGEYCVDCCQSRLEFLHIHQPCRFFFKRFRVQTVAIAMNATESVQTTLHRSHACAHFLVAHFTREHTFGSRAVYSVRSCLHFVHYDTDAIDWDPCETPLWGGPSGHLADPTPRTFMVSFTQHLTICSDAFVTVCIFSWLVFSGGGGGAIKNRGLLCLFSVVFFVSAAREICPTCVTLCLKIPNILS